MVLLSAVALLAIRPKVTVSVEPYRIWPTCYRISNGLIDCVVVPAIGRVMRVGRVGGPNLLFESPLRANGSPVFGGAWQNFGGDKIWPAPQSGWNWPPEPEYDVTPWHAESLRDGVRIWTTRKGAITGLLLERTIRLKEDAAEVDFDNRYTNGSQEPKRCAGWQVCQVDDPVECQLPRDSTEANPKGWSTYDPIDVSELVKESSTVVSIRRSRTKSAKFGSTSAAGFVSALVGHEKLTLTSAHPTGEYVDGGRAQQVYISQDPAKYAEIEITGPLKTLSPGSMLLFQTKLKLEPAH